MNKDKTNQVLDAAMELFSVQGFDNTSTQSISKKAGIGTGTLFKHFGSKDGLIKECYFYAKFDLVHACKEGVDPDHNFEQMLRRMWSNLLKWCLDYPDRHTFIQQIVRSRFEYPQIQERVGKEMLFFQVALASAQNSGVVIDVPKDMITSAMFMFLNMTVDFIKRDPSHHKKIEQDIYQMMINSLGINRKG